MQTYNETFSDITRQLSLYLYDDKIAKLAFEWSWPLVKLTNYYILNIEKKSERVR